MSIRRFSAYTSYCTTVFVKKDEKWINEITKGITTLKVQGNIILEVDLDLDYEDNLDNFRAIIASCVVTKAFVIITYYSKKTSREVVYNVSGYYRANGFTTVSISDDLPDVQNVSPATFTNIIGGVSLQFGNVPIDNNVINVGSISNALRFNVLSLSLHNSLGHQVYSVGWHMLLYIYAMQMGINLRVIELHKFKQLSDRRTSPIVFSSYSDSTVYHSPISQIKLGALALFALVNYDTIVVLGGFPGEEIRSMHAYIKNFNKKVYLIDPSFSRNEYIDGCTIISDVWNFDVDIHYNLMKLSIVNDGKCIILDDTWIGEHGSMSNLLMQKLEALIPSMHWDVLLKFNWYKGLPRRIHFDNFRDIMILPGTNDSTESRILLQHGKLKLTLERSTYMDMMCGWRNIPLSMQTFYFGYYVSKVIISGDAAKMSFDPGDTIISLFALGNLSAKFDLSTILKWHNHGINFIGNFYVSTNNKGASIKYKEYSDIVYPVREILNLYRHGFIGLTFDKLYNLLVLYNSPRKGFSLDGSKERDDITDAIDQMRSRTLITNFRSPIDMMLQTSLFSFGYRLKSVTVQLRSQRLIGISTTYYVRFKILQMHTTQPDYLIYDPKTHMITTSGLCTFNFHDKKVIVPPHTNVEVSGHVLNLALNELLEPGSLGLWVAQIRRYYELLLNQSHAGNELKDAYRAQWHDYGLIEVGRDRILKSWHKKVDMLLASLMIVEYWDELIILTDDVSDQLAQISGWLYDAMTEIEF